MENLKSNDKEAEKLGESKLTEIVDQHSDFEGVRVSETRKSAKSNVSEVNKCKATDAILSVNALLRGSVLSDVARRDAIPCGNTQFDAIGCDEARCDTIRCDAILSGETRADAILSDAMRVDAILSDATRVDAILCDGSRCDAILRVDPVKSDAILDASAITRSDAILGNVVRIMNSESPEVCVVSNEVVIKTRGCVGNINFHDCFNPNVILVSESGIINEQSYSYAPQ